MNEHVATAEMDAAFAVELARSKALQQLIAIAPRHAVEYSWRMGYLSGRGDGLKQARELLYAPAANGEGSMSNSTGGSTVRNLGSTSAEARVESAAALPSPVVGVCLQAAKQMACKWPRCDCRVDIVYNLATIHLPKPSRK